MSKPAAVCPNGHAMDEGLFNCPACGAYRASRAGRTEAEAKAEERRRTRCCGIRYEHGALTSARPCHDCPDVARRPVT